MAKSEEPARASPTKAPPTPRGGGRGPAAALAARCGAYEATPPPPLAPGAAAGIDASDEALPPGVQDADFKTLQAMIEKGLQDSEENSPSEGLLNAFRPRQSSPRAIEPHMV